MICRSEVVQRAGAAAVAQEFLRRAEDLALDLRPEPESEFGAALGRARAALS